MDKTKALQIGGFVLSLVGFGVSMLSNKIAAEQQTLAIKTEVSEQLNTLLLEATKDN